MPMSIRDITEKEREQLRELTSCADGTVARRGRAVLMASEGTDSVSIARSLEVSERTVRYAVERFNSGGPEALKRRVSSGRPRSVSDFQRESLVGIIHRSPEEFGVTTQRWDLADLAVVARSEGVLPDVSHWTIRREIARLIDSDPELRGHLTIPNQKQPGAPPGNRNAVRHGAYVSSEPCADERALIADIEARFLRDFPRSGKDDTQLIRAVAEACLTLNRGMSAGSADATIRADRRFRKAVKALKAKKPRGGKPQTTPAEWAADLLRRSREG